MLAYGIFTVNVRKKLKFNFNYLTLQLKIVFHKKKQNVDVTNFLRSM